MIWLLPIAALAALFIGFVTLWNRRLTHEIAERKRAEGSLQASEEQFRGLAEGSIQGIMVHQNRKLLYVNQALAEIFGYGSPEEVLGLGLSSPQFFAPEERERMNSYGEARLRGGEAEPTITLCCIAKISCGLRPSYGLLPVSARKSIAPRA